ncbi:hypothetical protein [Sulfurovum sp. AR]|uniref:hypothetical protein n=1 Tax=Sulfurovum sp. AR TaxID=1165841 RepID=UPI00025C4DA3|nr:hypothetical protein [Sulfurovum sp. AR]EIF50042.1 autotransporter adhesin [Sulfurovum sp. AR]
MKNSYKLGLAAISASIALVGCGGGSTGGTPLTSTGKAYYIDNAVGGVNYVCGSQEGITGPDGSFTFEVGSSCTFYLGDLKLRDVAPELLVDGTDVYETDNNIREILLSLDEDGDTSNGITINATIVEALATEGITSLPTNRTEMDALKSVIETNGGTVVTELEAQEHFLVSLLDGKPFYIVDEWHIMQWTAMWGVTEFNTMIDGVGAFGGALWIDGDKIHLATNDYYMVKEVTAEYILIDSYVNGTLSTTEKFYFDEAKAQADLDSRTTPMTTAMLSGKVFYADNSTDFEMISFISSSEVIFREILLAQDGTISVDTGANAYPYTINASGDVVIDFGGGNINTYKLIDATTTQWNMVKNGDATSPYSTWLLNAPSNFPVLDPVPTDPIPTAAEIESFVSGKDFWVNGITVSYASDYSYSDNDNCTGTWTVSNNTLTVTGGCSYNITFNEALVDGMTVTLNITDTTPVQTVDVTFTEDTSVPTPVPTLEITEALLSGKTFYEQDYETDQNNVKIADIYGEMTLANGVLTRTEVYVDVNTGAETVDKFTLNYIIVGGKIKVDLTVFNEGYGQFTLNAESTDAWDLTMEDDRNPQDGVIDAGSARPTTWYLSKPVNYPDFTANTTPILDPARAAELETFVSGNVLVFNVGVTSTFAVDGSYSEVNPNGTCSGQWAVVGDTYGDAYIGTTCSNPASTVTPTSTTDSDMYIAFWGDLTNIIGTYSNTLYGTGGGLDASLLSVTPL